mgnify:CR=1 FL=1
MNINDFCQCKNPSSVYTETDNFYQYDICNDCGKVLEDGIRSIDDNGDTY